MAPVRSFTMMGGKSDDTAQRARPMTSEFFSLPVAELGAALIGASFCVDGVGGIIVETEAYAASDPASHSFKGRTHRNASMFGPAGRAYVYRVYGLHWCFNIVGGSGSGSAVLIRALEPVDGIVSMQARRGTTDRLALCSGPGRLAQALGITGALDGAPLDRPPFHLSLPRQLQNVSSGRRIGIRCGVETLWRFGLAGSRYLSRPIG